MPVNQEAFQEVVDLIEEFPELHHQRGWESDPTVRNTCGTTRCLAGWAVWVKARELGLISRKRDLTTEATRYALAQELGVSLPVDEDNGLPVYEVLGAAILGLNAEQANSLFYDFNSARVLARAKSYAQTGQDLPNEGHYHVYG